MAERQAIDVNGYLKKYYGTCQSHHRGLFAALPHILDREDNNMMQPYKVVK